MAACIGLVIEALRYASSLAKDVRAVYVNVNPESLVALKRDWPQWGSHVKLVVLQSPYRSMTEPLLHNQSAFTLKAALLFRPRVVTTSVPFHLKQ